MNKPRDLGKFVENAVTVFIDGQVFSGWESVSIRKSISQLAHSFTLELSDKFRNEKESWLIIPGKSVAIFIDGEKVVTGFIDSVSASVTSNSRGFSVSGRSKTCDLIDCSIDLTQYQFQNLGLLEIAQKLTEQFGITVSSSADLGAKFTGFTVKQGETYFEALNRAAQQRAVLLTTTPNGNLSIERTNNQRSISQLVQGINIKGASANYSYKDRFSQYKVLGQSAGSDVLGGAQTTEPTGQATDSNITRFRPMVLIDENNSANGTAEKRAQWEASFRAAKSNSAEVEVVGWKTQDNNIWQINRIVKVKCPFIGLANNNMLIDAIAFNKSKSAGTTCSLSLTSPQAYVPRPTVEKDASSNLGWLDDALKNSEPNPND